MQTTYRPRKSMSEQLALINECRKSGLSDADWCRDPQIPPSTFYSWVSRCRKAMAGQMERPHYGHSGKAEEKQAVVPVTIIDEKLSETTALTSITEPVSVKETGVLKDLDNSYTIEIILNHAAVRISNDADTVLLKKTVSILAGMDHAG